MKKSYRFLKSFHTVLMWKFLVILIRLLCLITLFIPGVKFRLIEPCPIHIKEFVVDSYLFGPNIDSFLLLF